MSGLNLYNKSLNYHLQSSTRHDILVDVAANEAETKASQTALNQGLSDFGLELEMMANGSRVNKSQLVP